MYHILKNGFDPKRLLFPGPEHLNDIRSPTAAQRENLVLCNRQLEGDDEQLGAITAIRHMPPGSAPFIVFGPWVLFASFFEHKYRVLMLI